MRLARNQKLKRRAEAAARLACMHLAKHGIPPHRVGAEIELTFGGSVTISVLQGDRVFGGCFKTALCAKRIRQECSNLLKSIQAVA